MYIKCACVYVGLNVLHAACNILYTCKSSLYFILVFFFGGCLLRASWKISFFSLNVLPFENKDYYYYLLLLVLLPQI